MSASESGSTGSIVSLLGTVCSALYKNAGPVNHVVSLKLHAATALVAWSAGLWSVGT